MPEIPFVMYSHSEYSDVWIPFISQKAKHLPNFGENIAFIDKPSNILHSNWKQIFYKEKYTYSKRLICCLKQLNAEYCIFSHEDMFLYGAPKKEIITKYITIMQEDNLDFVKLIKGGQCTYETHKKEKTLHIIDNKYSEWIFAIQPSIWKINSLISILKKHKSTNIWKLEEKAQNTCKKLNIKGAFSFERGEKRGEYHWDNTVYPYIATAIVKGKWNISEYPDVLPAILKEYHIDVNKRGIF